jgi:hypothetical protein
MVEAATGASEPIAPVLASNSSVRTGSTTSGSFMARPVS